MLAGGAFFVAWAALRGYCEDLFFHDEAIVDLKQKNVSCAQFYWDQCDWKLFLGMFKKKYQSVGFADYVLVFIWFFV